MRALTAQQMRGLSRENIRMLTAYPARESAEPAPVARAVLWLDLLDPTKEERAEVESKLALALPSREQLSEVESSSRTSEDDGVLFLSMPIFSASRVLDEAPSPIRFVLSSNMLVTIWYT
jgi:magnesium transporter